MTLLTISVRNFRDRMAFKLCLMDLNKSLSLRINASVCERAKCVLMTHLSQNNIKEVKAIIAILQQLCRSTLHWKKFKDEIHFRNVKNAGKEKELEQILSQEEK